MAQYISHNICHVCGTVWRSVRRVARVMALASEASTPCQLQPGTLAILKEANSCTIWQSLGGRYPGAPETPRVEGYKLEHSRNKNVRVR